MHPRGHLLASFPRRPALLMVVAALILSFALLPWPLAALMLLAPLPLCILLVDPVVSLFLAILSVPIQDAILLAGGVSFTQAAMLLLVFHCALSLLAHPRQHLHTGRLFPLWLLLLWVMVLSAALTPYPPAEGVKETLRWAEAFVIWLIAVNLVRRPWHVAGLIACLLAAPTAEALYGLFQFAAGAGPPSFRIAPGLQFVRAYGTIGQPNSFGAYMNMAWPLALALALGLAQQVFIEARRPRRAEATPAPLARRWWALLASWGAALLLLAGLAASFSRGAWVGAAAGMLGMALALGGRARWWALVALALAAVMLTLGGIGWLPGAIAGRLASITRYASLFDAATTPVTRDNFAIVERMSQMQAGWRMFLAHPLLGVGPGSYSLAYPSFAVGQWYVSRGHAHNYYLNLTAELGLVGLTAYLALLAGLLRQLVIALRSAQHIIWRSVALGCCGIIAAMIGHDLFENVHVLSMGIQLAAIWGLLDIAEHFEKRPQHQTT